MRFLPALLVLMLGAVSADAQLVHERFLVPLYGPPISGAYGSRWGVETWVRYSGAEDTQVIPRLNVCSVTCTVFYPLHPGEAPVQIQPAYAGSSLLLHVDRRLAAGFHFSSRLRDLARADGSGTEVPVIHESRMSAAPVHLLNVPLDRGSRNMLRVYALPEVLAPAVEVRYFRMPRDPFDLTPELLRADRVALQTAPPLEGFLVHPSMIAHGFHDLPELRDEEGVWLEIVPLTPGLRIWAMVSVTNNATQHVTLVTPATR